MLLWNLFFENTKNIFCWVGFSTPFWTLRVALLPQNQSISLHMYTLLLNIGHQSETLWAHFPVLGNLNFFFQTSLLIASTPSRKYFGSTTILNNDYFWCFDGVFFWQEIQNVSPNNWRFLLITCFFFIFVFFRAHGASRFRFIWF